MDLHNLFQEQTKLLQQISLKKKRYLYDKIDWNLKSIALLGQRGLGKTTMMLQYIKEHFEGSDKALYVSLDSPYFQTLSLVEFAKEFEQYGGEMLFIDEVHKYDDWSTHVKHIYDTLDLQIVISGSSILQISKQNADLSRRTIVYHLENLSLREYLLLKYDEHFEVYSIENILKNHLHIAGEISKKIKPLKLFKEYLQYGNYPFILEDKAYIRKGLKIQLKELKRNIEVVGESASVKEALNLVERLKPNLILLDIQLLDGSAFDFLDKTKFNKFNVIIITSYDNYAIQALKHGALDYILKPIDLDELSNAIDKVKIDKITLRTSGLETKIVLNFINGSEIVKLGELLYCKSYKGYTTFYMRNGKEFLSSKPLKEYEDQLIKNNFIRTHQSYFVNSDFIQKFDSKNRKLLLIGNIEVPVSARKIPLINSYFNN